MVRQLVSADELEQCAEAAFMASAGWRLKGAWEFLDESGKNRWRSIAQEVILELGLEIQRKIIKTE